MTLTALLNKFRINAERPHARRRTQLQHNTKPTSVAVHTDQLESRTLLSVTPLTDGEVAALQDAVDAVAGFGERLESSDVLSKEIPIIGRSIGELVDVGGAFQETFVQPVHTHLATASPTVEGLGEAISTVIGNLGHADGGASPSSDDDNLSYSVDVDFTRELTVELDLSEHFPDSVIAVDGVIEATLTFNFDFDLTFGIDRRRSSLSDGIYFQFKDNPATGDMNNAVSASITIDNTEPIQARVGFLGVSLDASAASLNLDARFDTTNDKVSLSELTSSELSSIVSFPTPGGDFALALTATATLGAADLEGMVSVTDTGLFDTDAPVFDVVAPDLDSFRTLSSGGILSVLEQAGSILGGMDAFDLEIPFTKGRTLSDVLNLSDAFGAGTVEATSQPGESGAPAFSNVQEFINLISDRVSYDKDTKTLEFDVSFDHTFDVTSFDLDLSAGLGDLSDFSFSTDTQIRVDVSLATSLTIGIVLAQPGAGFDPATNPPPNTPNEEKFGVRNTTPLALLNGGRGIPFQDGADFRVFLRDGSAPTEIDIVADMTVGELVTALTSAGLRVDYSEETDVFSGLSFFDGLVLIDESIGTSNSTLRIERLNDSHAATALGLSGTGSEGIQKNEDGSLDEVTHGIRTGPLHGQSVIDSILLRSTGSQCFRPAPR